MKQRIMGNGVCGGTTKFLTKVYRQAARRAVMVTWFLAYLIPADDTVGLQRFPPAQTNLLLIAAAHDGIYWDGTGD